MTGVKRYFKIMLMVFFKKQNKKQNKKKTFGANVAFWAQELHFLNFARIKGRKGTRKSYEWFRNQLSGSSETNPPSRKWGNVSFTVENCFLLVSF